MFALSNSEKMDEFMALAARTVKPAREAQRPTERKPSYKFDSKGELVFENAPKSIENPYKQYQSSNKKIVDVNTSIDEAKAEMETTINDARSLRSFIAVINKANTALQRNVVAKNQKALDVLSVFSTFGMPKKSVIKTDSNGKQIAKTFEAVSPARAVNIFEKFVQSHGYTLSNSSQVIRMNDLADILAGVSAGKALKAQQNISTVLEAIKKANQLDDRVAELQKTLADLSKQHNDLTRSNKQEIKISVPVESVITKKNQDVKTAGIAAQHIESEITRIASRIAVIKSLKNQTIEQVKKNTKELQDELAGLHREYKEYEVAVKKAPVLVNKQARISKVLDLQEKTLARKREEKINALNGEYARLPKQTAAKKIKAYMKSWDKVQREKLAERNEQKGNVLNPSDANLLNDQKAKLASVFSRIIELDDVVRDMKQISNLTSQERETEAQKLQSILTRKREDLKSANKKIVRRKAQLESELDADLWEARIDKRLADDPKFVRQANRHMPLSFALIALHSGAEKRTKEMMRYAWEHFNPKRQSKITGTLKQKLAVAPVHFGAQGFVVDPRYPKINPQLVMMLDFGIKAELTHTEDTTMADLLLKACMDAFKKDPESLTAHKEAFEAMFNTVGTWLKSSKAVHVLEEIVEELVEAHKIETASGKKMNKKQLLEFTHDMVDLIRNAHALKKLSSFVWPSYREEMHTWLRNSFRIDTTKKGAA